MVAFRRECFSRKEPSVLIAWGGTIQGDERWCGCVNREKRVSFDITCPIYPLRRRSVGHLRLQVHSCDVLRGLTFGRSTHGACCCLINS